MTTKDNAKSKEWLPPPRFLFRKYSVLYRIKHLGEIKNFLDVGCGAGAMACIFAKELGIPGKGVDFSSKGINSAIGLKKRLDLKNVEFIKLNAEKLPNQYKSDLVTCFEVLEHVEDDKTLLKQLVKLSNKYVIISVPAKQHLFNNSDVLAGHYRRYEKKALQDLLRKNNLEIISFDSYGYPYTNLIRLGREFVANKKLKKNDSKQNMEQRSKKSGTDLLDINKFFSAKLPLLIKPAYLTSRVFNKYDFSEGYLVVCEKTKIN